MTPAVFSRSKFPALVQEQINKGHAGNTHGLYLFYIFLLAN
jgi:hypothetical protein